MGSGLAPDSRVRLPAGQSVAAPDGFVPFQTSALERSIPRRFEQIAAAHACRLAVTFGGCAWSYADLKAASTRVADVLRAEAGPVPQPVALLIGQGLPLIAAILGVLEAGHFYVPLDATHPLASSQAIVDDCGAGLVLADPSGRRLAAGLRPGVRILEIGEILERPADTAAAATPPIDPGAIACIYYTSGTTGRPKGVVNTHRTILHNVLRYTNGLKITPGDRLTMVQSPTFSGVMSSLFGALLNGARLCPYDLHAGGIARIGQWMREERITIYHSVPAIFRQVLAGDRAAHLDVRVVRLEGDGATPADVALFRARFSAQAILAHGLGATECGLVCRFVIDRGTPIGESIVPLGYAVDGVTVRVVNDEGVDVPAGHPGEICVESEYLSPGYWNRPDLTAAAFSADPGSGLRRYRTGDLGRMHPDGCLEHLGRLDGQPKVRGVRVDVASIEAALVGTGLVREAVAAVQPSASYDGRLIAYIVPVIPGIFSLSTMRRRLALSLPAHAMPARFVVLDALPTTVHHKIDRAALPVPPQTRPVLDIPYLAPGNAVEAALADAFEQALDIAPIGVLDDFFDLGGDSLASAAMLALASTALDRDLSALSVFQHRTVRTLASACAATTSAAAVAARSPLVPIQASGHQPPFFFVHAEYGGDGSYCFNVARHVGRDRPFFGLSPLGRDGHPIPDSVEAIAAAYIRIVRESQPHGPYALGGFCSGGVVAWEMACQLWDIGVETTLVLVEPPPVESGRTTRAIHAFGRLARQLGASEQRRARFVQRGCRLARLRHLPVSPATFRTLPARVTQCLNLGIVAGDGDGIARAYSRLVAAYLPRPFGGAVLCIHAAEATSGVSLEDWRRHAPHLTAKRVPGDHNSCIVTHSRALGRVLASWLDMNTNVPVPAPRHSG